MKYNPKTPKMIFVLLSPESLENMRQKVSGFESHPSFSHRYNGGYTLKHATGASIEYHLHEDGDVQSIFFKETCEGEKYINGCRNPKHNIVFFSIVYTSLKRN